jgi:hypothetical protein
MRPTHQIWQSYEDPTGEPYQACHYQRIGRTRLRERGEGQDGHTATLLAARLGQYGGARGVVAGCVGAMSVGEPPMAMSLWLGLEAEVKDTIFFKRTIIRHIEFVFNIPHIPYDYTWL